MEPWPLISYVAAALVVVDLMSTSHMLFVGGKETGQRKRRANPACFRRRLHLSFHPDHLETTPQRKDEAENA